MQFCEHFIQLVNKSMQSTNLVFLFLKLELIKIKNLKIEIWLKIIKKIYG